MRAIVLYEFGSIDKLLMTDSPLPESLEDEAIVKVKAISINPVDVRTRSGYAMADQLKGNRPLILGWDISVAVHLDYFICIIAATDSMPDQRLASRIFSFSACWLLSWLAIGTVMVCAWRYCSNR
jgi:hypothetical protein